MSYVKPGSTPFKKSGDPKLSRCSVRSMTMPRKGSRSIKVDDVYYRYMVRESKSIMSVTVEDKAWPGHMLFASYASKVCPAVGTQEMKAFIKAARTSGWTTSHMGNFTLTETQVIEAICSVIATG
jgi:hypothetical protein